MEKTKIGNRLLAGGILAIVLPIAIIGIVSFYQSTRTYTNEAERNLTTLAESMAGALEMGMEEQLVTARNISFTNSAIAATEKVFREGPGKCEGEISAVEKELTRMKDAAGDRFSSLSLVGRNTKRIFASSDSGKFRGLDLSERDYLKKALTGIPAVGSVVFSKATGKLICTVAYPVYTADGKDITGASVIALWLNYLTDIVDAIEVGTAGFAYIVNHEGLYITSPVKENILKANIAEIQGMETIATETKHGHTGIAEYTLDGVEKVAAFAPVPLTGWSVVTSVPRAELIAPAKKMGGIILAVGVAALILGSVFFTGFARGLTRPLGEVVAAAERISSGDLGVRLDVAGRTDEIGTLSRTFIGMIEALRGQAAVADQIAGGNLLAEARPRSDKDIMGNALAAMVSNLRNQIREMLEAANVLASSSSEIMASMAQVTSGAVETSTSVSETSTTVEEVKQTSSVTAQKARHVSDTGRRTAEISREGLRSIQEAIEGMNRIREQMGSVADTVIRLSEQSQAIGEIIATVSDLTEQSNILAVNASIEAAKAGEQGKGFSVVAQEMRSLAVQSKQSTAQIRTILNDIQKAIGSAVMSTEQGSKAVDAGVKISMQAREAIRSLDESITEAANAAVQIAASTQQQFAGMDQVAQAMESIKEASAQTAASVRQTERAVHDLHDLGQKLQHMVNRYKV